MTTFCVPHWRATCALAGCFLIASAAPAEAPKRHRPPETIDQPQIPLLDPRTSWPATNLLAGPVNPIIQVNVTAAQLNIFGDAANEPSIAVDLTAPNRMVIGWRQFDNVASNFRQAGYGYTKDGGRTWAFPGVLTPGTFRSDPVLDSDVLGNFYYYSLTQTQTGGFLCHMFKSSDGGATWGPPVPGFGGDKQWMIVDRTRSIGQGNIYAYWNAQFSCCEDTAFTRSIDSGASFQNPLVLSSDPFWGTLAQDAKGDLYILGVSNIADGIVIVKSTDAKDRALTPTFPQLSVVDTSTGFDSYFGANSPNPGGLLGQGWIAVDQSGGPRNGHVYWVWSLDPVGGDPLNVYFSRSTDGGKNWSNPQKLNDDTSTFTHWQWFGTMSIAPNGRLDVVWNDTRNTDVPNLSELFYTSSSDGGDTWTANQALSPVWDSYIGWPNQNKIGDYYGMISDNVGANLAWAATFNGEQDVYFLRIGSYDCNGNSVADEFDIAAQTSADCNDNGIPDSCEIAAGAVADVNGNGVPDSCDCPADLFPVSAPDGAVGPGDLGQLLSQWGPCPAPCDADLFPVGRSDGVVGPGDLGQLLSQWGQCPQA